MVYYVAFYARPDDNNRRQNLAGVDKADYIIKTINDLGEKVIILSNAKTISNRGTRTEKRKLSKSGIYLHTFSSWRKGNRLWDVVNAAYGLVQLLSYLIVHVSREDTVCVYHSMGYRGLLAFVRKIKKFTYILEVEELFQYFAANKSGYKKKENNVFLEPDAFIFSNRITADEVNKEGKSSVIVNGVYKNEKKVGEKHKNDTIVLVYAGSLEPQKGIGIILDMASHLNNEFELRIIGFGSDEDINEVIKRVESLRGNGKKVIYDGVRTGRDYREYLQNCDIGLCIQDDTDEFNKFEFPSKVISYMANGLDVITNELIQIKTSEVAEYINIVDSNDAEKIAEYINNKKYQRFDAREAIKRLDSEFHMNMSQLIKDNKRR